MKILIIDNYDSFTFNLYQCIGEILLKTGKAFIIDVFRNDQISIREIQNSKYHRIVISPGPGNPADSEYFGVCAEVLTKIGKTVPVLGVCLGMQGMAHYFGGKVIRAKVPMHGKTSMIRHDGKGVFQNLPQELLVMRYHSLVADPSNLPDCLEISATVDGLSDGEIMGLRHKEYPIEGIQFHPESFATEAGKQMLSNFLFQKI